MDAFLEYLLGIETHEYRRVCNDFYLFLEYLLGIETQLTKEVFVWMKWFLEYLLGIETDIAHPQIMAGDWVFRVPIRN